jgi:hypothetical protein
MFNFYPPYRVLLNRVSTSKTCLSSRIEALSAAASGYSEEAICLVVVGGHVKTAAREVIRR